jgi:Secretion system C-terminal sorting domain
MKTKLFFVLTLFCGFFNQIQAQQAYSNGEYLTGVINERWGATSTWENNNRFKLSYTTPTNAEITAEEWNGFSWDLTQKGTVTLTPNYAFSNITWQKWDGTQAAWRNKNRSTITYYNNDPAKPLVEKYDTANAVNNAVWDDANRTTYTYNPNGLQLQQVSEKKNGSNWQGSYKTVNTYNANGLQTSRTSLNWSTSTNSWAYGGKSIYYYNTNSLISLQIDSSGSGTSSPIFRPSSKIQYFYNVNNLVAQELGTSFDFNTNTWNNLPSSKSTKTYNAQNLLTQITFESDYALTGTFTLSSTQTYAYNAANNWVLSTTISATSPTSSYRTFHTYGTLVGTENTTPSFDFSVFPNPTAEQINLTLPENAGVAAAMIIAANGQIVKTQNLTNPQSAIDVQDLAAGSYQIILLQNGKSATKMFVKQ